jgi:hypothetical protein
MCDVVVLKGLHKHVGGLAVGALLALFLAENVERLRRKTGGHCQQTTTGLGVVRAFGGAPPSSGLARSC